MRRSALSLLALGGILLLGFAGLIRSQDGCATRACPMMQQAAGEGDLPCHGQSAVKAAMDCCSTPPATAPAGAPSLACPHAAGAADGELPACGSARPYLGGRVLGDPRPHRALLHDLGLYTLHSVFRI